MIRFQCRHCGAAVRTADNHAGKRARCPFCRKVLTVPATAPPEEPSEAMMALAAANRTSADDADGVPPPPEAAAGEEPEIAASTKDPSEETDILPAVGLSTPPRPPDAAPTDGAIAGAPRVGGKLWVVVALGVAALGAGVCLLLLRLL
jgi:hypothetical protein